jgi:hypothetical protein
MHGIIESVSLEVTSHHKARMALITPTRRWTGNRALAVLIFATLSATLLNACGGVHLQSPISGGASGPPPTFVLTTSDTRSSRVIDVRDGLTKAAAFKAATDLMTQRFSIDVSDQRAGFVMSPWQASFIRDGAPDLRYRMRVIIRFLGDDWKQVSVRTEANWQRGDEWDIGYDSKTLDDVSADLRNRVGKRS